MQTPRAGLIALALSTPALAQFCPDIGKVVPSGGAIGDRFGVSIALSGDTMAVGAANDDEAGADSGSVSIFTRTSGAWVFETKVVPLDGAAGDQFGRRIALDGDTLLVGSLFDDDVGTDSGSAYVFTRSAGAWAPQAKIVPVDGAAGDQFGSGVALHGSSAVIGAQRDDDRGADAGSAYVYIATAGVWNQEAKLIAADGAANDLFGTAVALDGGVAVVGASQDNDRGSTAGSAYAYRREAGVWSLSTKLLASDGGVGDYFGRAVAVRGDWILAAAPYDDTGSLIDTGAVYAFRRGATAWAETHKLTPAGAEAYDYFGFSLSMNAEGTLGAIGSPSDEPMQGTRVGTAYLFRRVDSAWFQGGKFRPTDGTLRDAFGVGVALDGGTLVASAYLDDDAAVDAGSAYAFNATACLGMPDCNANTTDDLDDIRSGRSRDVNDNLIPDECESPVPCAIDFNGDGLITIADFLAFIQGYAAGCP